MGIFSGKNNKMKAMRDELESLRSQNQSLLTDKERLSTEVASLASEKSEISHTAFCYSKILNNLQNEGILISSNDFATGREGNTVFFLNKRAREILTNLGPVFNKAYGHNHDWSSISDFSLHIFHDDPEKSREILKSLAAGETRQNPDMKIGEFIIRSSTTAIGNEDGQVVEFMTSLTDVTWEEFVKNKIIDSEEDLIRTSYYSTVTIGDAFSLDYRSEFFEKEFESILELIGKKDETTDGTLMFDVNNLQVSVSSLASTINSIRDIVTVILDIAERTQLLSLNANIEAAKAGDFGRGFSVVAGEVSKLANEATDNAAKIKKTVSDVIGRAKNTTEGANKLTDELHKILEKITLLREGFYEIKHFSGHLDKMSENLNSNSKKIWEISDVKNLVSDDPVRKKILDRIFEHMELTYNLIKKLRGKHTWKVPNMSDCQLEKWSLAGAEKDIAAYGEKAAAIYKSIKGAHTMFHDLMEDSEDLMNQGKTRDAYMIADDVIVYSIETVDKLFRLYHEIISGGSPAEESHS